MKAELELPKVLYRKDDGVRFLLNEDEHTYSMERPRGVEGVYHAHQYMYETLMRTGAFVENISSLRWPSECAKVVRMDSAGVFHHQHAICIHCGETNELALFQLRNGHNDLVGMAFICKGCRDIAPGIKLIIEGIRGHGPGGCMSHVPNPASTFTERSTEQVQGVVARHCETSKRQAQSMASHETNPVE